MFRLLLTLGALLSLSVLFAQPQPSSRYARIPTLELPPQNNGRLLARELAARKPGRAPQFAHVLPLDVRPTTHGEWTANGDGTQTWRLRLSSPTALSLNLGFTEYQMPEGGELYLHTGRVDDWTVRGPFTPADNQDHNQLWTPILPGDQIVVEVTLPADRRPELGLWLTHIGHDYLGFLGMTKSGSCNIDVACGGADGYPQVDPYRSVIRAVAVYGFGGGTACTGFLINNVRQDQTPFFMTAAHCGVSPVNAPSMVVYWNYENSSCRAPNSAASGAGGDGSLATFNSGAVFRAGSNTSDFVLVELDEPVNSSANAYFAGWDRSYTPPSGRVVAIHHPNTEEKRITFTNQQTYFTNGYNGPPNPNGTHLHVPDWDLGTTEPGSSGSPIFDASGRVRGQLHGGLAACGNNSFDTYGAFARSWTGNGGNTSRLRNWLDPDNTGTVQLGGINASGSGGGGSLSISVNPAAQETCGTEAVTYDIALGNPDGNNVSLSIEDLPAGLSASFDRNPVPAGANATLTVTPTTSQTADYRFTVTAQDDSDDVQFIVSLDVERFPTAIQDLVNPADGLTDAPQALDLAWSAPAGATGFDYEVATDPDFRNVVRADSETSTQVTVAGLPDGTTFYWRVREANFCGVGPWSATRSFTTVAISCGETIASQDVPVPISPDGRPTVTSVIDLGPGPDLETVEVSLRINHTYVGDLRVSLVDPDGTSVLLFDRIGRVGNSSGCEENNLDLTFSDSAAQDHQRLQSSCAPGGMAASGTYQPAEPLSGFAGSSRIGSWVLRIEDQANRDGGALLAWGLRTCSESSLLPVELTSFDVTAQDCGSELRWTAAREVTFRHYEVQAGAPGVDFATVATVLPRPDGNYVFRTPGKTAGERLYRLKMVDLDGSHDFSDIVRTTVACAGGAGLTVFPNPSLAANVRTVRLTEALTEAGTLEVFSAAGRRLHHLPFPAGQLAIELPAADLPPGAYLIRLRDGRNSQARRFVVQR